MTATRLDEMMKLSQDRAEAYLHLAKGMVMNDFGPATDHTHTEVAVALATAMMQHEGAQMIVRALRMAED